MPLTHTRDLMTAAQARRSGVAAFNVICLEHAEAVIAGAQRAGHPVIVQISQNTVGYHGGALRPIALACLALAEAATVPVALHLDHATTPELCRHAVELGFGSVMYDGSTLPYERNLATTAEVVAWAHERGAYVEAELGMIGGKGGAHAPGVRTDPAEAADFVAGTRVDALAVAVGTSHAMLHRDARLDLPLIARLNAAVPVPLVLHGSSGVPDDSLTAAVAAGITKVNLATQLNQAFTAGIRAALADDPDLVDPRRYLRPARVDLADVVARLLRVISPIGRPGRADPVPVPG